MDSTNTFVQVKDDDIEPVLDEITCHMPAHVAKPDEANPRSSRCVVERGSNV
jgi:hypothetical protein